MFSRSGRQILDVFIRSGAYATRNAETFTSCPVLIAINISDFNERQKSRIVFGDGFDHNRRMPGSDDRNLHCIDVDKDKLDAADHRSGSLQKPNKVDACARNI